MIPTLTNITCESCKGAGTLPGPKTGRALKRERKERGVGFNEMLTQWPYSKSYLVDLEKDQRAFSNELVVEYRAAVERAVQQRLEELP